MLHDLTCKIFSDSNYEDYKSWFSDAELTRALGNVDQEWLDYILSQKDGEELAFFEEDILVCVVGIVFPEKENNFYSITNIAVNPTRKNSKIGSSALKIILEKYKLEKDQYWQCFIDKWNMSAQSFFEKNLWRKVEEDRENLMLCYRRYIDHTELWSPFR